MNEFDSDWISLSQSWSESVFEWIWEKITRCLNPRWQCLNPRWQNSRWLPSSSWVRINEWSFFMCKWWGQEVWVKFYFCGKWWEPILASVKWEWEEDTKMCWIQDVTLNPRWQNSRWLAIIKLSENEWVWVRWISLSQSQVEWRVFLMAESWVRRWVWQGIVWVQMAVSESKMAEFKMAAIIKLRMRVKV